MKKIFKCLFAIAFACLSLFCVVPVAAKTNALVSIDDNYIRSTAYEYLLNFLEYNAASRKSLIRTAGTFGERLTAGYITEYLEDIGTLQAKTNSEDPSIAIDLPGLQKISFYDIYDGSKKQAYNVVYTLKGKTSNKKIVISTNYDNDYIGYLDDDDFVISAGEDFSEGVNASAASVAVLLTLAEILPANYFDFDIEFVFFAAGYNNNAGARYYNQTLSTTERENVLLMLDISRIALGEKVYYYSGAFGSEIDEFYSLALSLTKYQHDLNGTSIENDLHMMGYENAGYTGSTAVFEGSGLNILHIFAGSYDKGVFGGFCEYGGVANIINTKNDNVDYIMQNYDHDLTDNMTTAVTSVINLLNNSQFAAKHASKPSQWQYKMFSANNYVAPLMLIVLIVLMIVAVIVHYGVSKKTFKYIADNKISGVMLQIDDDKPDNKDK